MKRLYFGLFCLTWSTVATAQQPVTITNAQAVDYTHDSALTLASTSGPLMLCRTSTNEPTNSVGPDTRAFAVWCHPSGALHTVATDNQGNDMTALTGYYLTSAASTNSTSVKASAGSLHLIHVTNTTATTYYLRLYDAAAAPTCSSATNFKESIPILPTSVNGRATQLGETYNNGIGFCLTGGGSSTDNTNAATGVYVKLDYR